MIAGLGTGEGQIFDYAMISDISMELWQLEGSYPLFAASHPIMARFLVDPQRYR